jgi:hypothetical protein
MGKQQCVLVIVVLHMLLPTMCHLGLNVNCQILLSDINQIWILVTDFCKSPQYQNPEIRLAGIALICADRRTDMIKLIGVFCDYNNAPKNL